MANIQDLIEQQEVRAANIEKIISNIKKAPLEKRTEEFYKTKRNELVVQWQALEKTENRIRSDPTLSEQDPYIVTDLYKKVGEKYSTTMDFIEAQLTKAAPSNTKPVPTAREKSSEETQHFGQNQTSNSTIRKLDARMSALKRLLTGLAFTEDHPIQYYELNISTIKRLWIQIEALYDEAHEQLMNPTASGLNQEEYYNVYDLMQRSLVNLSVEADKIKQNDGHTRQTKSALEYTNSNGSVQLPKVTIPRFDGDYLKWRQFYDLFSEMVDKQPISSIQKMWYLKSNLSGEAEHLISQLSLSETNYKTAWETLKDRYNNKRILVANLVDKILNQPSVTANSTSIKALHDTTNECLHALNNLGITTSSWDAILMQVMIKKLDRNTHVRYMQSLTNPREVPIITEFLSFLEFQFQSLEAVISKEKPTHKTVSTIVAANTNNNSLCKLCNNSNHKLYHCSKFLQLSPAERLHWVQRQSLCVNCFGSDHASKICNASNCRKCGKKHNTLLHLENNGKINKINISSNQSSKTSNSDTNSKAKTSASDVVAVTSATTNVAAGRQGYVLLATAKVIITASNGVSEEFKAILDSASQVNIVSKRLCQKLSISPFEASLCIDGVGEIQKKSNYRINVGMKSRDRNFSTNVEAYVLPSIIPAQPNQQIDISTWDIPSNIHLADPHFHKPEKIDLLLGAEFFFKLMQKGTIHLADNLPTLQNTVLGWIVGGTIGKNPSPNMICASTCAIFGDTSSLEEAIEQLWKLDEVECSEKSLSPSEKQCEAHFSQHVHTNRDGRFIVSIPFRENPTALGESHAMAYNRFLGLERRLQKNEDIRKQYIQFMGEYEKLGHMHKIDINTISEPKYIIPHHCVLKPDSTSTKLRVVFDASAKTSSGYSLNDLMYTGPTVQGELFSILLRFRLPKFVFTTDIEKMYRQILVSRDDQKYQLIIWREDPSLPVNYYKLNTVTYGTRAAPYLATKCLQKIAEESSINYPYGSKMLKNNFYVDDGLGGSDSLNIALETQKELITILRSHGFNLKKWCANHPQLLKNIPFGDQELDLNFNSNNDNTIKTLGLLWLPNTDQFCVKVKMNHVQTVTKRTATSDLARLFDPLGLLAPVVVKAKMFIQQLWQLKLDWDEALPEHDHISWTKFRGELEALDNFKIHRHIFKGELPAKTELHIFSDASERAFGAVAYLRAVLKDGRVIVQLLCAKTRVAPLKQQTIPRLELCAAVMAAQLVHRIQMDLQNKSERVFLWTDSEIVLSWINSQSSAYHTFVANRVSKIQLITLPDQWRHVRSKDNPADILSRGIPAHKISECNLWLYGPMFLHGREEMWPPQFSNQLSISNDIEKKKSPAISAVSVTNNDFIYKISHKNSFKTLQRIVGYVLRYIQNSKIKRQQRPTHKALSPAELDNALSTIMRTIQVSEFSAEINQLQRKQEIDKKSSIISLAPFLDETNLLRVGGRLEASSLSFDSKYPILIPYNDPLVKLLFVMVHVENKHCGPQALLNIIRQRFWPIKGKIMARATVQKCIRCVRARPQLCQQIMGNLPQTRVTPARPFVNTGVDYCGPFWIHYKIRGKKPTKAYIAVFCCFATKATHLELVTDLSTEAFIGALKRFISRRGRCQNIYSDNATNFIGAKNQLLELASSIYSNKGQELITSTSSANGINFHFIPPRAPHFGGLWEAAVKSAKHLLLRSVATASLTLEELETIVVEIEAILNSRPLTPISSDPSDLEALTPGHFLIGEALVSQIHSNATSVKTSVLSHWKLVTHLKQEFWKRWSTEYLNLLQQRNKWNKQCDNLKIGDMVIVKEDNLPVMKWPLARIINVFPGNDNVVRVVEVKTANGLFKRPIHRVALLPIEPHTEEPTSFDDTNQDIENSNCDPISEPSSKKRRTMVNNLTLALITILLLLPISFGTPIKTKKFGTKLGIHFEEIGTTAISTSEWNIFVYYDLGAYWSETSILINGTKSLQHLCTMIRLNESCINIIKHFEHMEGDLQLENQLLRSKRGALNVVGNVANSLFGILDSEYADQISNTIQRVKENESYLLTLLKNQTSIVDSTINIIRETQLSTKARFEQLERKIEAYSEAIRQNNDVLLQIQFTQLFNSGILELSLVANNIRKIQSSILDTLMDTHHGKISPLLLTPQQLQNEITQIKLHTPSSVTLPTSGKNELLQLFKLMKVQGRLTQQHAVFKITLPLVELEHFKLFQLIPVPNLLNNTMVSIKPCSEFIGITTSHKQYILLTQADLSTCDIVDQNIFVCPNVQARYNYGSEVCRCETNLYNNKTTPTCTLEETTTKWIPLNRRNQWIYATASPSRATVVCNREITHFSLRGSGFLTLAPDCILKHEFATLNGRQIFSSTIRSSYTSLGTISDLSSQQSITSVISNHHSNSTHFEDKYPDNIKELSKLQKSLKEQNILNLPNELKSHQQHSHTIGYLALGLSLTALIIIILRHKTCKKKPKPPTTMPVDHVEEQIECQTLESQPVNTKPTPRSRQQWVNSEEFQ